MLRVIARAADERRAGTIRYYAEMRVCEMARAEERAKEPGRPLLLLCHGLGELTRQERELLSRKK